MYCLEPAPISLAMQLVFESEVRKKRESRLMMGCVSACIARRVWAKGRRASVPAAARTLLQGVRQHGGDGGGGGGGDGDESHDVSACETNSGLAAVKSGSVGRGRDGTSCGGLPDPADGWSQNGASAGHPTTRWVTNRATRRKGEEGPAGEGAGPWTLTRPPYAGAGDTSSASWAGPGGWVGAP